MIRPALTTQNGEYLMDTRSLEDWYRGQPAEIWRRIEVTGRYQTDGLERIHARILEGPEIGREISIPTPPLREVV